MKIAPKAVETLLGQLGRPYRALLLYGPDAGLVRHRAKTLAQGLLKDSQDPFSLVELSEASLAGDPARLADELSAISLLASQRVILLGDAGDKMTSIIESASAHFDASVFLIVIAEELSPRSSLRAWFEKHPEAAAVACYKDEIRDVQAVIRREFDAASLRADREVVDYIASQLGNDRYVTLMELEKLITYAGESRTLSLEEAMALVDYNRDTGFDDIAAAAADRNMPALEATLAQLLREGNQPMSYLRSLMRYFNRLYFIRAQMDSGQSAEQVISGLRPPVFFRAVSALTRHAHSWTGPQIVKALRLLVAAELACKTSDLPPVTASSRRLLQLTQVR